MRLSTGEIFKVDTDTDNLTEEEIAEYWEDVELAG